MELRLRNDQVQSLTRIAAALGVTVSDVVRWFIDQGTQAVEGVPSFKTLEHVRSES